MAIAKIAIKTFGQFIKENLEQSQPNADTSKFTADALVEGDMLMSFQIKQINEVNSSITMYLISPINNGQLLFVYSNNTKQTFDGPIYDAKTRKPVYKRASFRNITPKNCKEIANKNNIPVHIT